ETGSQAARVADGEPVSGADIAIVTPVAPVEAVPTMVGFADQVAVPDVPADIVIPPRPAATAPLANGRAALPRRRYLAVAPPPLTFSGRAVQWPALARVRSGLRAPPRRQPERLAGED